ncbi:3-hydroxyacyl-CoA dehydrogenase family protein [Chloroflexota bacterium]
MRLSDISKIAVLGTGAMAPGIAQLCAQAGYEVAMWGRSDESLVRGFGSLNSNLSTCVQSDLLRKGDEELVLSRVRGVKDLEEAAGDAQFIIEAIAEDMALKKQLFARLDRVCPEETILSSNTSGLSITDIAADTGRPDRVIVTHFWNPPHLLPLVEVVRGEQTSDETAGLTRELLLLIGKSPVMVKRDVPGFIGNRLQFALLREALYLVEQGIADIEDVDNVVKWSFGRRLGITGPIESVDLGGLDVFLSISEYLMKDICDSTAPSPLLVDNVERGSLGAKSGSGLYDWTPEDLARVKHERMSALIELLKKDRGFMPFEVRRI